MVPLLNFEGGPGVLLLNYEGGPVVSLLNFEGGPGSQGLDVLGPGVLGSWSHFYTMPSLVSANHSLVSVNQVLTE